MLDILLCGSLPYPLGTRSLSLTALVRVSIAVTKHHDLRNLGQEGFSQLMLPHHNSSWKEVRIGAQARQGPG